MLSICNHKADQLHMKEMHKVLYDLCCSSAWLLQKQLSLSVFVAHGYIENSILLNLICVFTKTWAYINRTNSSHGLMNTPECAFAVYWEVCLEIQLYSIV